MAEILLNTRPQHTNALFANSAFADKDWQQQFYRNNRSIVADILQPYQPYMLNGGNADTHDFYNQMCTIPQQQREVIGHTVESIGSDNTLALAAMYDEHIYPYLKDDGSTLSGALAGTLSSSRNGLMESMSKYEKALLQIYEARKQGATKVEIRRLEQIAKTHHGKLQTTFEYQLKRHLANFKSPRARSAIASANRGTNIAMSGRLNQSTVAKLEVTKSTDVKTLRNMSRRATYLGNSVILIDAGLRAYSVADAKQQGQDYHRVAVQEITGFGASTAAGAYTAQIAFASTAAAMTKVGIALGWTPAGWVILAGAGLTALAAGYYSAKYVNSAAKTGAGVIYDRSANYSTRGRR
ncbi:hypothetical protein HRH59_07540 [Rheinheimera sp. YQF-2]|uniref:Uncharacterized protein n=1 Tax=Rheinheimera lutimaris TaxID=2740584 RepID=A0A7Y5AQ27_9GAMM|nr:hypothetical protein [Rheinheimera lutimaris]NRQ42423.1 hypothetical protein [Rheinheimera lutimaris]